MALTVLNQELESTRLTGQFLDNIGFSISSSDPLLFIRCKVYDMDQLDTLSYHDLTY